jgi:sulfite dehydrogenase (cytochrome) subunit B
MTTKTLIALCGILSVCSCRRPQQEAVKMPPNTFTINGSVREINIWPENTTFPEHAGKAEFVSYCGICHSLKYISSQPDFPRKTWDAEVHKMITKYNAPIDSVTGKKIVDYLVAIKSK